MTKGLQNSFASAFVLDRNKGLSGKEGSSEAPRCQLPNLPLFL
jgi:hypothetical protein